MVSTYLIIRATEITFFNCSSEFEKLNTSLDENYKNKNNFKNMLT